MINYSLSFERHCAAHELSADQLLKKIEEAGGNHWPFTLDARGCAQHAQSFDWAAFAQLCEAEQFCLLSWLA